LQFTPVEINPCILFISYIFISLLFTKGSNIKMKLWNLLGSSGVFWCAFCGVLAFLGRSGVPPTDGEKGAESSLTLITDCLVNWTSPKPLQRLLRSSGVFWGHLLSPEVPPKSPEVSWVFSGAA
jgi:hypothetical protein